MSGTDHSKAVDWAGPQPAFVLIEPQMGENIGSAARAMWNFGLEQMRIVNPRDGWPNPKAVATSSGAGRVMDNVQVHETTPEALGDLNFVFATTARSRDLTKPVYSPEAAMKLAREQIAQGNRVGVMFGPERAGLANDDIVRANALISVPVNPAFASLNLAQCVLLLSYEWRRQTEEVDAHTMEMAGARMAEGIEIEKLADRFETRLDEKGFFFPPEKATSMKQTLRNLFSRLPLTDSDVRTFHGIVRALAERGPKKP